MILLNEMVSYLNDILAIDKIQDASVNGLQVEGNKTIKKAAFSVDMTFETVMKAAEINTDILIVHHGIFWKNAPFTITGIHKQRIEILMNNHISLYAAHLPLDLHNKYGNNISICKRLGLNAIKPFGEYHGVTIGYYGNLNKSMPLQKFCGFYKNKISDFNAVIDAGVSVKKICVVSGGGADLFYDCVKVGADTFITGEQNYTICNFAKEYKVNIIFGGHYNTETFGVKELMNHLKIKFNGLQTAFIDCPSTI